PVTAAQADAIWRVLGMPESLRNISQARRDTQREQLANDLNGLLAVARSRHHGDVLDPIRVPQPVDRERMRLSRRVRAWRRAGHWEEVRGILGLPDFRFARLKAPEGQILVHSAEGNVRFK